MRRWFGFFVGVSLLSLSGCASVGPGGKGPVHFWDAERVAQAPQSYLALNYRDTATGKQVTADWIEPSRVASWTRVKSDIERAAAFKIGRFTLTDQKAANAFAGQDRNGESMVAITIPMIALLHDDPDAIAVLLGHEISHLVRKHGVSKKQRHDAAQAASIIGGVALGLLGVPMAGTISSVAVSAVETSYSRDDEREADADGVELAVKAGYSPDGAVRLFQTLERANAITPIPFLSSHPGHDERIETARTRAAQSQQQSAAATHSAPAATPSDTVATATVNNGKREKYFSIAAAQLKGDIDPSTTADCQRTLESAFLACAQGTAECGTRTTAARHECAGGRNSECGTALSRVHQDCLAGETICSVAATSVGSWCTP